MGKKTLEDITKEVIGKQINPLEGVKKIDKMIMGITKAIYNPGRGDYKIYNHNMVYKISVSYANKKNRKQIREMLALAYWKATQNGSKKPGEFHGGKGCSTKHYTRGYKTYVSELLLQYT